MRADFPPRSILEYRSLFKLRIVNKLKWSLSRWEQLFFVLLFSHDLSTRHQLKIKQTKKNQLTKQVIIPTFLLFHSLPKVFNHLWLLPSEHCNQLLGVCPITLTN